MYIIYIIYIYIRYTSYIYISGGTKQKTETSIPPPPAAISENSCVSVPDPLNLWEVTKKTLNPKP